MCTVATLKYFYFFYFLCFSIGELAALSALEKFKDEMAISAALHRRAADID